MQHDFRTIGLIAKAEESGLRDSLRALAAHLEGRGCRLLPETAAARLLDRPGRALPDLLGEIDLAVVLGGDGTMLKAARAIAPRDIPMVGVNAGRLGFLADLPVSEAPERLDRILAGDYRVERRALLRMEAGASSGLALNDVVVQKRDGGRMIEFETWVDGVFVCAHRADGIVIATPTGSTAYALSSGGPILNPGLDALALVPICPHTLSDRPLVISGDSRVEIVLTGGDVTAQATCDGQSGTALAGDARIAVQRAAERVTLLHPADYDYFRILRTKLHWGRGRNHDIGR